MNLKNLQFLFKPNYWSMNYCYNKEVDLIINELLDKYDFSDLDDLEFTCKLGKATIWVGNIPYASFRLYGTKLERYRPSRLTILKALDKFNTFKKSNRNSNFQKNVKEVRNNFLN